MTDHLQPYREALERHGAGFEATLWGSPATQALRFAVLTDMLGASGLAGSTVLDVGCGDGALARWLAANGVDARVHGIDAMPAMVAEARTAAPPDAAFDTCDVLGSDDWPVADAFDIVVLSGTMNTMQDHEAITLLERSWARCRVALAFNVLGDAPGPQFSGSPLGPARRHDVAALQAWAGDVAGHVDMRDEYLDGHDVSFVLRRAPDQA